MTSIPVSTFDHDSSAAQFAVSKRDYLEAHQNVTFGYIATSALVLDGRVKSKPRVLLLQRAASDDDGGLWEPPGGACEDDDQSILYAAARELWEEAGLLAAEVNGPIGIPHFFALSDGKKVCQFNFTVRVKTDKGGSPTVRLNPEEHQQFVWASENDIRTKKADGVDLVFTRVEVERTVNAAFEYYRQTFLQQSLPGRSDSD